MYSYQPLFSCSTSLSAPYILRSFGFSIFPVALRGISANIISFGRLYLGSSIQKSSISSLVQTAPSFTSMIAAVFSPSLWSGSPITATSLTLLNLFKPRRAKNFFHHIKFFSTYIFDYFFFYISFYM